MNNLPPCGILYLIYKTQVDFIVLPFPESNFLNHKSQNSNPKQISMTKIRNPKRFEHWVLEFGAFFFL
jgi:hypothetical protein